MDVTAGQVVAALAAADPVYDTMNCFFCKALAPIRQRGPGMEEDCEDHDTDCPWWMARQMLGVPSWPTEEEEAARA